MRWRTRLSERSAARPASASLKATRVSDRRESSDRPPATGFLAPPPPPCRCSPSTAVEYTDRPARSGPSRPARYLLQVKLADRRAEHVGGAAQGLSLGRAQVELQHLLDAPP